MADEKPGLVPIVVAIVGVIGSIIVAAITSGRTFDNRFNDVQKQTEQITTDVKSAKQEIDKSRQHLMKLSNDTQRLQNLVQQRTDTQTHCTPVVHEVHGMSAIEVPATAESGARWADYPELRIRLTLRERRAVAISYQLTDAVIPVPGWYILARLDLDGEPFLAPTPSPANASDTVVRPLFGQGCCSQALTQLRFSIAHRQPEGVKL